MNEKNKFGQIIGKKVRNWQGAKNPLTKKAIHGRYSTLEPLDPAKHSPQLFNLNDHDQSWTYLPYGPFNNIDEFQGHLQEYIAKNDNNFRY